MINIFYKTIPTKKLNGSLFYCFEYFAYLFTFTDVQLHIQGHSENDVEMFKEVFKDRYDFNHDMLNDIKEIKKTTDVFKIEGDKSLFLDYHSFDSFYLLVKNDIFVYKNKEFRNYSSDKNITYFGYYDYQSGYDIKEKLKFNFSIYKDIDEDIYTDVAYVSSPGIEYNKILDDIDIKEPTILTKDVYKHKTNLFESFDTLYYYHVGKRDVNNRLIPECFYYDKSITLIDDGYQEDSVYLRYSDILENGLDGYTLSRQDKLIKALLA